MLSVSQAQDKVLAKVVRLADQRVSIARARDRFVSESLRADRLLPPWDNSAMDGYAVRAADVAEPGVALPVAGVIAAGDRPGGELGAGKALRIMTGAPMPSGADTVIIRENAREEDGVVRFEAAAQVGQHIRRAGEDVAAGAEIVAAGQRLGPGELAMLAAQGRAEVTVAARPRVAIVCTGDELCPVGTSAGPGQIYSSNEHALAAQAEQAGAEVVRQSLVGDRPDELEAELDRALEGADVVITSGGVSVGDFDFVRDVALARGVALDFWKVAVRPGKPVAFGDAASGKLFFGLPGNPVSSLVSFELFVRPALLALQGASQPYRARGQVVLAQPIRKQPGRALYVRAALDTTSAPMIATPHSRQGSGMLSSLVGVDALIEIAAECADQPAGTELPALLLRWS